MRSMTGYGVGEAPLVPGKVLLEMRSLNHRFLEVRVRMPPELAEHAFYLEQRCREKLTRGRYDVVARFEAPDPGAPVLDMERARRVFSALAGLRDELCPGAELPLNVLGLVPDLFVSSIRFPVEVAQAALADALDRAASALDGMRQTEGERLAQELSERLDRARRLRETIKAQSAELARHYRTRLRDRLERLLEDGSVPLEPGRLEAELALIADKSDITEELVRLEAHLAQFGALFSDPQPIGRRLDFLLQELGREANTIGAKCQDAGLSHLVVELKAEVERMREQVQNVE